MAVRTFALALLTGSAALACGASVSKTYESDVRFERCYALDWKKDVDAGIRQRCWEEWVAFFAAGQPKDRIEYAKTQTQLASDGGEPLAAAAATSGRAGQPLPEPTSVFAPVPMMAATASASVAPPATSAKPAVPRNACETRCDKAIEACLSGCGSPICEQFCAQKHDKCAQRCEATRSSGAAQP
jgi:hypothetical protein